MQFQTSKGRDCIETKSTKHFNCSLTCEGIHADVKWVEDKVMSDLERRKGMKRKKRKTRILDTFQS